jgi:MFS family permease
MSLHKAHQNPHRPKVSFVGQLVCPHCQTAFPITWRRYWSATLGNYRCPECRQISQATANFWWVLPLTIVATITGAILGVVFAAYVFHIGWTGIVFLLIGGLAVGLPLDKWMDGHLRRLEPREANSASVLMKYLKALLFFLITYLFVAIFCSLIITSLLFGRLIIYVGTSDDWRTWPANILGILAGIYAAEAALNPKPRKNKNRG